MTEPLPVEAALPALREALAQDGRAVLTAPPGSGKTTRAPLALLTEQWAGAGRILLLSPRRVAARAAAHFMARSLGESVGETVGFSVRLERKTSSRTRVEVVTEGVFTRRILNDPELAGVSCVIFDEFHERSLDGDLGLALAWETRAALREDLRLLVMSATLEADRIAAQLDDARVVAAQGRLFPVSIAYVGRDARTPIENQVAAAARRALAVESGSVLCFLPGAREIERAASALHEAVHASGVEIHTLYGAMDTRAQDAAIAPAPPGKRKVVLASAIAETSLTIEGVRVVIDSGLSRRARFDPSTGLSRLETGRASQASAAQRAGRAGRLEPGVCWRLWHEGETRSLPAYDPPEILEADLTGFALDLAEWGQTDPAALRLLDPPPPARFEEARRVLQGMDALDVEGRITAFGRTLARFAAEPRLAAMILRGAEQGRGELAARLAVLLSEQGLAGRDVDLRERLAALERDRGPRANAAKNLAARQARMAGAGVEAADPEEAGLALAHAFPDRIAKARPGKRGEFLMANGRAANLGPDEPLARETYLVVADALGAAGGARITAAAPLNDLAFEETAGPHVETRMEANVEAGALRARRVRRYGAVTLSSAPVERPGPDETRAAWMSWLASGGAPTLLQQDAAAGLRARVAFMRNLEPNDWPDWSEPALLQTIHDWLAPHLDHARRLDDIDVRAALLTELSHAARTRLDREAPERYETPAGFSHAIDYAGEAGPIVAVRVQEMFGLATHPTIASGRAPLVLSLVSPADRPVQTTKDLPGFWRGSYAAVKAEMKGRYPKHPWPDDPASAAPTRRAKPRP